MVERVDLVLLESQEGRPHLEQAAPALAAGKPMYIDKPVAASLVDAVRIYQLANESGTPCFSSSANRFIPEVVGLRNNPRLGRIVGCDAYSPAMLADPRRGELEPPGDFAGRIAHGHGQGLGDAAIPFCLQAEPGREVDAKSDLVGHGGSGVFHDGLDPLARLLVEAIQAFDGEALLALGVFGEDLADPQMIAHATAFPELSDAVAGQHSRIGEMGLAQLDQAGESDDH